MKYLELNIKTDRDLHEELLADLISAGFSSFVINDPDDLKDIEEHPEWYKYDYINEELADRSDDRPCITLYFSDDEEGRSEAARAEALLDGLHSAISILQAQNRSELVSQSSEAQTVEPTGGSKPCGSLSAGLEWSLTMTPDDSEWLYKWQENFKPAKVGEHIVVCPSWEEYDPADEETVISMDPGMAFGSGLHETTSMCIRALEKYIEKWGGAQTACFAPKMPDEKGGGAQTACFAPTEKEALSETMETMGTVPFISPIVSPKVLDVGTGTGILAIAAALLGAEHCLGIDIDEDAVRIARENVERNGLSNRIQIETGDLLNPAGEIPIGAGIEAADTQDAPGADRGPGPDTFRPDVIVANLMADLVIRLAPAAAEHLAPGGIFISSGVLDIKEDVVREAVRAAGFEIEDVLHDGEWRAIIARRI